MACCSPRGKRWPGHMHPPEDSCLVVFPAVDGPAFAVYLAGSGRPVGVPGARQGPGGSRRATPYLYSFDDIRA